MAFKATLNFGGKDFDILACNYKLNRDVDPKGRPASPVYGGRISVTLESTDDTSVLEQMVNEYKPSSGTITFKKTNEDAKMKELKWDNGYIVAFEEKIDINSDQPMVLSFTVTAEKVSVGNAKFEQKWPEK